MSMRNLEVTLRSLGWRSKKKMQEDWESIDFGTRAADSLRFRVKKYLLTSKCRHCTVQF